MLDRFLLLKNLTGHLLISQLGILQLILHPTQLMTHSLLDRLQVALQTSRLVAHLPAQTLQEVQPLLQIIDFP